MFGSSHRTLRRGMVRSSAGVVTLSFTMVGLPALADRFRQFVRIGGAPRDVTAVGVPGSLLLNVKQNFPSN
jgi:hypothetical protein